MNKHLDREKVFQEIKQILESFDANCHSTHFKKGIYVYGSPGCGKTRFVMDLLEHLNYDVIKYDAGDVRNKNLIDTITNNNMSGYNVLHLMNRQKKRIAIVMDEIDGMNNGDKGGLTSLIKLIRQKKTKKQKSENSTTNPIICIGNYCMDKKIKELMKVCNVFELKTPTTAQIERMIEPKFEPSLKTKILKYIQGDMRKLEFILNIYKKNPKLLTEETLENILMLKSYNYDAKKITHELMNTPMKIDEHTTFMNETSRTVVSLLYHENIIDALEQVSRDSSHLSPSSNPLSISPDDFYLKVLENICYADYIDRVTFQNQIWIFNEMSSLMKTFYNNHLFHSSYPEFTGRFQPEEVRFTKVLTKYSTEYNNQMFLYNFCQELNMDKKDVLSFFQELRLFHGKTFYNQTEQMNKVIFELFQFLNISKLDIKRLYRFIDKNIKQNNEEEEEEDTEEDSE